MWTEPSRDELTWLGRVRSVSVTGWSAGVAYTSPGFQLQYCKNKSVCKKKKKEKKLPE
jgi:hypothetical protein